MHAFLFRVELQLSRLRQIAIARGRKDIEKEVGIKRIFSPKDSVLPSWPLPRASFLSASTFGFAFTKTTTTSSSGGGGGGGGGGFERLQNKNLGTDVCREKYHVGNMNVRKMLID